MHACNVAKAHLKGEHELVALKQPKAGVVIDIVCERLYDVAQASLQCCCLRSIQVLRECSVSGC